MATRLAALGFLITLFLSACTNAAKPKATYSNFGSVSSRATNVGELQFFGQDSTILTMAVKNNQLHLSGPQFLYAAVDIGTNPEDPDEIFVAAKNVNLFSPDPPFGGWTSEFFGSGAIALRGTMAYLSGTAGMSVINLGNVKNPVEVQRYPPLTADGEIAQDLAFVYKAIVAHPSLPLLYGFAEQDFIYTIDISTSTARVVARTPYSNSGTICCVDGATVYNGKVYIAMRGGLRVMSFGSNGSLNSVGDTNFIQATGIAASSRYLYVHHEPASSGVAATRSAGIYVFDPAGQQVNFFPVRPRVFAVHPADTHLYANSNDTSLSIYRLSFGQ